MARTTKEKPKTTLLSMEDVDKALLKIGRLRSFIDSAENEMNDQVNEIKEKYEKAIRDEKLELQTLLKDVELYCIENKNEFQERRSRDLTFGIVGFRFTPSKVTLLNRKYTWDTCCELVKKVFGKKYIREKQELNKENILTDASRQDDKKLTDEQLASVGLKIDSGENFYIEIKWENINEARVSRPNIVSINSN